MFRDKMLSATAQDIVRVWSSFCEAGAVRENIKIDINHRLLKYEI